MKLKDNIKKLFKLSFYLFLFLSGLAGILMTAFLIFYGLVHTHLETKYRSIQKVKIVKFEDTLDMRYGIPLYTDFVRISDRPYSINNYDCSNKSKEYYLLCKAKGLKPLMILTVRGNIGHALVWVEHYGLYDVTNKTYHNIPGTKDPKREFAHNQWLTYMFGQFFNALSLEKAQAAYPTEFNQLR